MIEMWWLWEGSLNLGCWMCGSVVVLISFENLGKVFLCHLPFRDSKTAALGGFANVRTGSCLFT